MAAQTDWMNSCIVPVLKVGTDAGSDSEVDDGYATGLELTVGTSGDVVTLRGGVYELQCRTQAIYYAMITEKQYVELDGATGGSLDDADLLALLNPQAGKNGHYLPVNTIVKIGATYNCKRLIIKGAADSAVVNIAPLLSTIDQLVK